MSKYREITFTDAAIVDIDAWIPAGEYNPHNVRPWLLHDHGRPTRRGRSPCPLTQEVIVMNTPRNTERPRYRPQYVLEPRDVDIRKVAECLEPLDRVIARLEKLVSDKR